MPLTDALNAAEDVSLASKLEEAKLAKELAQLVREMNQRLRQMARISEKLKTLQTTPEDLTLLGTKRVAIVQELAASVKGWSTEEVGEVPANQIADTSSFLTELVTAIGS